MTARPLRPVSSRPGGTDWPWLASALEMAAMGGGALMTEPAPKGRTCGPRIATHTPGADARSVREARDFTRATLRRWGVTDRAEDIVVVVSELLTNAMRHARPELADRGFRWPVRLDLVQSGPCVLSMVADPSNRPPVPQEAGCLAETGRGLQVIAALSDQWGYTTPSEMGKVVWAMFSTTPDPLR